MILLKSNVTADHLTQAQWAEISLQSTRGFRSISSLDLKIHCAFVRWSAKVQDCFYWTLFSYILKAPSKYFFGRGCMAGFSTASSAESAQLLCRYISKRTISCIILVIEVRGFAFKNIIVPLILYWANSNFNESNDWVMNSRLDRLDHHNQLSDGAQSVKCPQNMSTVY